MSSAYRYLFGVGILLIAVAVAFGAVLLWHGWQARALSKTGSSFSGTAQACSHPIKDSTSQLVMSKNDTRSVMVELTNTGKSACKLLVKLEAPHFAPASEQRVTSLAAGETRRLYWPLSPPDRLGDFHVKVTAALDEVIIGIRVTHVLGLSAAQAELLAYIGVIVGGSGVSVPWLHTLLTRRKQRNKPKPPSAPRTRPR